MPFYKFLFYDKLLANICILGEIEYFSFTNFLPIFLGEAVGERNDKASKIFF